MITVVLPVLNEEKQLDVAITCLFQQKTSHPFEVVVVDNGSSDNSVNIAQKYPCRVVSETQRGITWARRCGVEAARGDIVVQFDADCTVDSCWLEKLTAPFFADPQVIFTFGSSKSLETGWKSAIYFAGISLLNFLCQKTTLMGLGYNMAYRAKIGRALMDEKQYLELRYYEDTYISFQIGKLPGKKVFVADAFVTTSSRRIQREPLTQRLLLWASAMLHYFFFRKLPDWAYTRPYNDYR